VCLCIKERVATAVCRYAAASDVCVCALRNVSPMRSVGMLQKPTPGGGVPGAAGRTAPPLVEAAHAAGSDSVTRRPPGTARSSVR
jgi:hypothetical protein